MNDKLLLEIENKISNNEHAKVIEILNIHFKKNGYKPLFLSYYIDCLIKLGLRDLACKNFELMMSWLTHLSHQLPTYNELASELPEGILPAYDGLVIE